MLNEKKGIFQRIKSTCETFRKIIGEVFELQNKMLRI